MKRLLGLLLSSVFVFAVGGCSNAVSSESSVVCTAVESSITSESESETEASSVNLTEETTVGSDTLVVYFSATGTTEGVALRIAEITEADIYEITATDPYTDEDRDWTNDDSRCSMEQNDPSVRPLISSEEISLEGYTTIYLGYPIWFGQEPRIMDTFVESYNFDGITVIPFCTSGSSDIGQSGQALADNAGSGTWLEGRRFSADVSDDEISAWIEELS